VKQGLLKIIGMVGIFLSCSSVSNAESDKNVLHALLFNNLGSYHHAISTSVPLAQRFFDQGLILFYGFEWGEAIRSFEEATRLDPKCGMCYWGLALALGNKINAPMNGHEYSDGKVAIQKALSLAAYETPIEQDYITALSMRFKHAPVKIKRIGTFSCHTSSDQQDESSLKERMAYAKAMRQVVKKYPQDIDAKALYGAALFWVDPDNNKSYNLTAAQVLKDAMTADPSHVGANHYFIHVTEPYSHPEEALSSADLFRTLVPGSEHLVHMPAHIYFLTGRYHEGTDSNLQAVKAYQQYNKNCRVQGFKPEINYLYFHNYDFLRTTAAMEGREKLALWAARQIEISPFPEWIKNDSTLQWFIPIPYYVEARFGQWNEILNEPKPKEKYSYALGMWHYARGIALSHSGNVQSAEKESTALDQIIRQGNSDNNLGESGVGLLKMAHEVLLAVIANSHNDEKSTISHLKIAMKMQDKRGYHEPPDWYFPVRQALGDAYLKWNHLEKAKNMYEQDLKQYSKNGWSLYGLSKSLQALGEKEKAAQIEKEFKEAWKYSDIPAPVSLF